MDNGEWTIDNYGIAKGDDSNQSAKRTHSLSIVNFQLSITTC